MIVANWRWAPDAVNQRNGRFYLNGETQIGKIEVPAAANVANLTYTFTTIYNLSVGDYVEIQVWQNSGGALDCQAQPENTPEFMIQRIGY